MRIFASAVDGPGFHSRAFRVFSFLVSIVGGLVRLFDRFGMFFLFFLGVMKLHRCRCRYVRESEREGLPYQLVVYAAIEKLFRSPTVPQLLVVVFQTLPVFAEFVEAVFVDVFESVSLGQS